MRNSNKGALKFKEETRTVPILQQCIVGKLGINEVLCYKRIRTRTLKLIQ